MRFLLPFLLLSTLACSGPAQEPRAWWSTVTPGPAPKATLYWRWDGRAEVRLRAKVAGSSLTEVRETTGPIQQDGIYHTTFEVLWAEGTQEQEVLVVGICPDGSAPAVKVPR